MQTWFGIRFITGQVLTQIKFIDAVCQFLNYLYQRRQRGKGCHESNILNPDYILIGGDAPEMAGFPKETLVERICFHARKPYPANNLNILFTGDEETKCVVGGAIYAKEIFLSVKAGG